MARKINTKINSSEYYRVTAVIGRNSNDKLIRKQFLNYAVDEGYIIKNPCWSKK